MLMHGGQIVHRTCRTCGSSLTFDDGRNFRMCRKNSCCSSVACIVCEPNRYLFNLLLFPLSEEGRSCLTWGLFAARRVLIFRTNLSPRIDGSHRRCAGGYLTLRRHVTRVVATTSPHAGVCHHGVAFSLLLGQRTWKKCIVRFTSASDVYSPHVSLPRPPDSLFVYRA